MEDGTIADVDRSSAQGTLTDVRPVYALVTKFGVSPLLGHCPRLNIRRVECERPGAYVAISDLLNLASDSGDRTCQGGARVTRE
jgi:hypothetical protein